MYNLGKWLKNRYKGLIDGYSPSKVFVKSSWVDRTVMSAQSVLAGLFTPEKPDEIWNKEVNWQPVPVYTLAKDQDTVITFVMELS